MMKISAINFYNLNPSSSKKSQNLSNGSNTKPTFKGSSEEALLYNSYNNISFMILGKQMNNSFARYSTMQFSSDAKEVSEALEQNTTEYKLKYDQNKYFDKTSNVKSTKLYIADPNEIVNSKIRENNGYIVYDLEPIFPTFEQLKHKYTSSKEEDKHDYYDDLRKYIEYQKRAIKTDEENIKKSEKYISDFPKNNEALKKVPKEPAYYYSSLYQQAFEKEKCNIELEKQDLERYKKRLEISKLKLNYAQNLYNMMGKTGDDFVKRDILIEQLHKNGYENYLTNNLKLYKEKKYLLDESIGNKKRELNSLNRGRYPSISPQEVQKRENEIASMQKESQRFQELYDESEKKLKELKNGQLEKELQNLLNKMKSDFEEIEKYYQENNLNLL